MSDSASARDKRKFAARLKEARIGDPVAQYDVALMYANGVGVGKNISQTFEWTKAAAEKGHPAAQYLLGSAYLGGLGTLRNEQKALFCFLKAYEFGNEKAAFKLARILATQQPALAFQFALDAAERGLVEAQFNVGDCYACGNGVAADTGQATDWYQRAAAQGYAPALYALGQLQEHASADAQGLAEAGQWYRRAAKMGHPGAQLALDRLDAAGHGRQGAKHRPGARERRTADTRWSQYAAHGREDDFYHLGLLYETGHSLERNLKQARAWYKKAAELGDARAQYALGRDAEQAQLPQAVAWLHKAALQGHARAQCALAERLFLGLGTEQDPMGALAWYARAAEQGDAQAQFALGDLFKNHAESMAHTALAQAAAGGQAQAQYAMGERCRLGTGVAQNWFEACRWYQMAAEQGDALAQCALAGCYSEGRGVRQDLAHAFAWYEKAAAQNLPQAQWNLGELYATGLPGVKADAKKATTLCKRAANAGFVPAQATLGALFARAKKHDRALHWWSMAAAQGDLEALFNAGQSYRLGLGVQKNETKAFTLLLKAAQGGLAVAQSRIGLAYATGDGVALDVIEAAKWFELAALGGDAAASANWERARKTLSPAQQTEADRRAQEWLLAHGQK